MREVQVIDQSSSRPTRADHVIGIDESGNANGEGPFALAAVRCERANGERLAELLVDNGLSPWIGKSQTLAQNCSPEERDRRVSGLIDDLDAEGIQWKLAVSYDHIDIVYKAAAACALAKKTITAEAPEFSGDSVLIPDGALDMYGTDQEYLRRQAAYIFDGQFQSTFGTVYVTGLEKADLTYPEVAAADFLAGYVRRRLVNGEMSTVGSHNNIVWYTTDWREPDSEPLPLYRIRGVGGDYGDKERTRIAAWVKGRTPDDDTRDISSQWQNTVEMLESEKVQQYLLDTVSP